MATFDRTIDHSLGLTTAMAPVHPGSASDSVTLGQNVVGSAGRFLTDALSISQAVGLTAWLNKSLTDALSISQVVAGYLVEFTESGTDGPDTDFIISAAGLDALTIAALDALTIAALDVLGIEDAVAYVAPDSVPNEPSITEPTGSYTGWTSGTPIQSVTLPTPGLGTDLEILTFTVSRRTMGGTRRQVRPAAWSSADRLHWTYTNMGKTQVDDFLQFVSEQAARNIILKDEYDRTWLGVITSPLIKIEQLTRNRGTPGCTNNALFKTTFDFEGAII